MGMTLGKRACSFFYLDSYMGGFKEINFLLEVMKEILMKFVGKM